MWLCSCQDNYQIYLNTAHAKYMYNMYINLYCHLPSAHTKTNIYHKLACWCLTVWMSMRSPFNAWFAHLMPALYSSGINTQWTKYNLPKRRQASIWIFPSGHMISQLFPAYINLQPKNHTRVFGIFGKLPKYNFHPQPTPANPKYAWREKEDGRWVLSHKIKLWVIDGKVWELCIPHKDAREYRNVNQRSKLGGSVVLNDAAWSSHKSHRLD